MIKLRIRRQEGAAVGAFLHVQLEQTHLTQEPTKCQAVGHSCNLRLGIDPPRPN